MGRGYTWENLKLERERERVIVFIAQLCLTLCDPVDYNPPGSSVHRSSRQEYWSGLPFSSPGNLPDPEIEPRSPALQADSLLAEPPGKSHISVYTQNLKNSGSIK